MSLTEVIEVLYHYLFYQLRVSDENRWLMKHVNADEGLTLRVGMVVDLIEGFGYDLLHEERFVDIAEQKWGFNVRNISVFPIILAFQCPEKQVADASDKNG